jgi:pSer/pThr/pTyr-binding forkhead associated (FHA) protein
VSFVLQRVTKNGLVLNQFDVDVLRIGRGTNAELRSENSVVSLEHAVIEGDDAGYAITDRGSITGTYVNRKPVETARLQKGDVIEIGELRIEVQLAERGRPLFLRVESMSASSATTGPSFEEDEDAAPETPRGGAVRAPQIDYAKAYKLDRPFLTRVSVIALVAIASLLAAGEIIQPEKQTLFMPGKVSSAHSRARDAQGKPIAEKCEACHDAWKGVSDARCTECHGKVAHAETEAKAPPCMSCHAEHREQPKLTLLPVARCIECHGNLPAHVKPGVTVASSIAKIDGFGANHPDFTLPDDPNTLRFNHQLHLAKDGVFNASGKREVLGCTSCHKLVETAGKSDPKPITFAADCQRCHKLTFTREFPDAEVPHGGDARLAKSFVIETLAGNRNIATRSPAEMRRLLAQGAVTIRTDERIVAAAEHVLKVKCSLCHEMRETVTKPVLRSQWFQSRFTHTPHRNLECEQCHDAVRASAKTSDVLMPTRDDCTSCHGAAVVGSHSSCMSCHDYHGRSREQLTKQAAGFTRASALPPGQGGGRFGMLEVVLIAAVVILLLVVLVPVGAALYKRLSARDEARLTDRQPTVRRQSARVPPPPIPQAPAPLPPPPAADETRTSKKEDTAPPSPQATELVQWYGMLLCTEGPLEGKRFMIEEDGFYIGRDSSMSQVVINDSRISKRHVRIVPRDGRAHAIDQDSTNGTFIGSTATPRITDVQLKRGDKLILGDNVITFLYQI